LGSGCQIDKPYLINNGLADTVTVKNTTGTGIAVPAGKTMWVYNNGTNVVDAVTHLTSLTLGSALPIASGGTGSTSTTFVNLTTNVTGTLPVANGGTGQTSYTDGQLLIGNTSGNTLAKATLTAGTGISVTNGAGTISIAATNNGTVTSVATGTGLTGGTITTTGTVSVATNGITDALFRQSAGLSVVGRSTNTTGNVADVTAGTDNQVLRRSGTAVGFGAVNLASSDAVTGDLPFSNLAQGSALSVLGVTGNATADNASIAAGTDHQVLRRSGTAVAFGAVNLAQSAAITGTLPVGNGGTGITSFGAGVATWLGTPSSANLAAAVTDETGSGALVFATSPTLVTPVIGAATGTSLALTGGSLTTRPAATQDGVIISGRAGGTSTYNVTITPTTLSASRTLPLANGDTTLQAGTMAVTGTGLGQFASTTSLQLAGVISDETGSGSLVFATSPTLVTPNLGTPSAATLTNATGLPIDGGTINTLPVNRGGTGQTTYTNGQLLIGNTTGNTLTKATLTAGSGISITNGAGAITIAATGGGSGTVTSVALSGGTTGLTVSGSPITTSGTITLAGTLAVANGGTGITSFGSGVATWLGTPSSANLAAAVTDETGSGSLVFATSPTLVTPVLGTPTSGTLSNCTVDGTDAVGFRNTPINSQSAAYTLVLADAGKTILHPIADNNPRTFTIPANSSVVYPIGTVITFVNLINTVTIAITSDTMYLAGTGTTGSRTLAAYGVASAVKVASTTWVISGNGLT
jgi:hypothetical protein